MSTDADRLNIVLAARDREFQRVMDRAIRKLDRLERRSRTSLSGTSRNFDMLRMAVRRLIPAMVALGGITALRGIVADLDNIAKTADRLGLTTDALQELRIAGEAAGVSQQTLDMAMQRFGRRLAEARQGSGEAAGALEEMGIALLDLDGNARSIEDVLDDVADSMSGMENQTDRNRIAMRLFDSEGVALVNMLRDGSAGLDEMREAARASGAVMEESVIRQAEEAQTQLDLMSRVISANLSVALMELAPLLIGGMEMLTGMARVAGSAMRWLGRVIDALPQGGSAAEVAARHFQTAIDNVTLAMADEITQSQRLRAAIGSETTMTLGAARVRLQDVQARRARIAAMQEENRQFLLQTEGYQSVLEARANAQATMLRLAPAGSEVEDLPRHLQDAYAEAERSLLASLNAQRELLAMADAGGEEARAEIAALDAAILTLEAGIDNAADGMVDLAGNIVEPIQLSERLADVIGEANADNLLADANALVEALGLSLGLALRIAALGDRTGLGRTTGVAGFDDPQDPRGWSGPAHMRPGYMEGIPTNTIPYWTPPEAPGVGGGTGSGGGQSARNDALEEAARIFRETRTQAELYAEELEDLQALYESGAISQDTFNRRMAQLRQQFQSMGPLGQELKNTIIDVFAGGENAVEQFTESLKRALIQYALFGDGPLGQFLGLGGGGGGGWGGLLGGLFGGFRADGGPVSAGRSYVVGERGPEIFRPGLNGSITPNHIMGGGGGTVTVIVRAEEGDMFRPIVRGESRDVSMRVVQEQSPKIARAGYEMTQLQRQRTKGL